MKTGPLVTLLLEGSSLDDTVLSSIGEVVFSRLLTGTGVVKLLSLCFSPLRFDALLVRRSVSLEVCGGGINSGISLGGREEERAAVSTALGEVAAVSTALGEVVVVSTAQGEVAVVSTAPGEVAVVSAAPGEVGVVSTALGEGAVVSTALGEVAVVSTALGEAAVVSTALGDEADVSTALGDGCFWGVNSLDEAPVVFSGLSTDVPGP